MKDTLIMPEIDATFIRQAILDYRAAGKQLMTQLGSKFRLDINILAEYDKLISRSNKSIPRKGELTKRWNYHFHGGECGFYNKKHQQSFEVVLSNPPEFGYIDAWFLMKYMESTKIYKDKVEGVNWLDLKPIISELYNSGAIKHVAYL